MPLEVVHNHVPARDLTEGVQQLNYSIVIEVMKEQTAVNDIEASGQEGKTERIGSHTVAGGTGEVMRTVIETDDRCAWEERADKGRGVARSRSHVEHRKRRAGFHAGGQRLPEYTVSTGQPVDFYNVPKTRSGTFRRLIVKDFRLNETLFAE